MGFLSKLTKGVGKFVKKNVSFKNLVKVVGKVANVIPVVGGTVSGIIEGAQAQHEAKKEEARYAAEQAAILEQQNAAFAAQQAELSNTQKLQQQQEAVIASKLTGVGIKEVLLGGAGGALQGAGVVLAGDKNVVDATTKLADNTIMSWLKTNWLKAVGIIASVVIVGTLVFKMLKRGAPRRRGRY